MARIGYVDCPAANIKLPIRFLSKKSVFTCSYAGTDFEHTDVQALKTQVLAAIQAAFTITWIPVIELTLATADLSETSTFRLIKERLYIGSLNGIGYKRVHWSADPERRLFVSRPLLWDNETLSFPAQYASFGRVQIYLPYDESIWNDLEEIEGYLQLATMRIQQALCHPDGITTLLTICRSLFNHFAATLNAEQTAERLASAHGTP